MPATQNYTSDTLTDCAACGCLHRTDVACPWGPGRHTAIAHTPMAAAAPAKPAAAHRGTRTQSIGTDLDHTARNAHTPNGTAPARRGNGTGTGTAKPKTRKSMSSRYPGTCTACGQRFPAGTEIYYAAGKATHAPACPEAPAAPVAAAPVERVATPNQINLIETLQVERGQPVGAPEALTFAEAKTLIPELIAMPKVSARKRTIDMCGCPEGRYAVRTEEGHYAFYNVTERGVFHQLSDSLNPMSPAHEQAAIAKIMVDLTEAACAYGRELGVCHCGRTLTNEESRKVGMGPICRKKDMW